MTTTFTPAIARPTATISADVVVLMDTIEDMPLAIEKIVQECPKLEVLRAFWCKKLTDSMMMEIVQNCPNIIELELVGCSNITETTI